MANELKPSIKNCIHNLNANKRYMRPEEVAEYLKFDLDDIMQIALAAGARYQLPRITLMMMNEERWFQAERGTIEDLGEYEGFTSGTRLTPMKNLRTGGRNLIVQK